MEQMRILHLLNHTQRLNGHVHAAVDLACAQAKMGHTVFMGSSGGDFDSLLGSNGVQTVLVDHRRKAGAMLISLGKLFRLARALRLDAIHAHMMTSALLAWPVCKLLRIPLVTTVHNEFQKSSIVMGLGNRVIAVSSAVGRSMGRRGVPEGKIRVVLNGTIGSARTEGKDRTPRELTSPAIVFVGGQHPRKGLVDLFNAFEIVSGRIASAHLYVIGNGPFLGTYMEMVGRMSCADRVHFLKDQENPFPFLLGADVFVLPSHADPAPLVLSEAREAGCAIVASEVDGIPELLEQGQAGILVPPRDPARLGEALCGLLENPDELRRWRQSSQTRLDYLRIERVARETLDVYACASRAVSGRRAAIAGPV
jgi:glycosyltransferase involved in cell wall biosynthesis